MLIELTGTKQSETNQNDISVRNAILPIYAIALHPVWNTRWNDQQPIKPQSHEEITSQNYVFLYKIL